MFLSFKISPFFPFYADEIYAGCNETEFIFSTVLSPPLTATFPPKTHTTSCPYSLCLFFSFKVSLFPFYVVEIYAGCDGIEFLFTVLSPPSTMTFLPTAQTTSCPYSLCLFFSFKSFLFLLFMQRKFMLDATELNFFLQFCPLREQRHFHQTALTTSCLYSLCLFSSFKISLFSFLCRGNLRWMRRN